MAEPTITREQFAAIEEISKRLYPILAGHPPAIQGLALADCLSVWITGHIVMGDAKATGEMWVELWRNHMDKAAELIALEASSWGHADLAAIVGKGIVGDER